MKPRFALLLATVALDCSAPSTEEPPAASSSVGAAEPQVERASTRSGDGVEIVYDTRGEGDTALVFVHCWACDRTFWHEQLDAFAESYRVVALDLAGHGESGNDREAWSVSGLADDVRAVIEDLGLERVILVGHSMGGPVALAVAGPMRDRVIGVACVDTLHNADLRWSREEAEGMAATLEADWEGAMTGFVDAMVTDETPEVRSWILERALAADRDSVLPLMIAFSHVSLPDAMAAAGVPIRCINAAPRPPYGPATEIEINREHADFDAVLMDNVGHYIQLERPEEFNRLLAAAIEELEALADDPGEPALY